MWARLRGPTVALGAATLGWFAATVAGASDLGRSSPFFLVASILLAVGLYGSTFAIDLGSLRRNLPTVLLAVTVGVLVKAALIAGVLYLAFRDPVYLLFGVAMAQIDPLSAAALLRSSRMSAEAKAILAAWASFDDPITTLLAVYLAASLHAYSTGLGGPDALGEWGSFGSGLVANATLAAAAGVLWYVLRAVRRRIDARPEDRPAGYRSRGPRRTALRVIFMLELAGLLVLGVVAVTQFLMLGLAVAGLFYRPDIGRLLDPLIRLALVMAAFALGLVLVDGINPVAGLVLGVAAFAAQGIVGPLATMRQTKADRVYLGLAQQNGITAILLALMLEPSFPGTVAVIAPAILVVNLLHTGATALWDRRTNDRGLGAPHAAPSGDRIDPVQSGLPIRVSEVRSESAADQAAGASTHGRPPTGADRRWRAARIRYF